MKMINKKEMSETDLKQYLIEKTEKNWKEKKNIFLLSQLSTEITKENISTITKNKKLKNWIEEELYNTIKVVQHPIKKAIIGTIPANQEYTFEKKQDNFNPKNLNEQTLSFIETAQQKLSAREIEEINIPFHIMIKLLEK